MKISKIKLENLIIESIKSNLEENIFKNIKGFLGFDEKDSEEAQADISPDIEDLISKPKTITEFIRGLEYIEEKIENKKDKESARKQYLAAFLTIGGVAAAGLSLGPAAAVLGPKIATAASWFGALLSGIGGFDLVHTTFKGLFQNQELIEEYSPVLSRLIKIDDEILEVLDDGIKNNLVEAYIEGVLKANQDTELENLPTISDFLRSKVRSLSDDQVDIIPKEPNFNYPHSKIQHDK